MKIALGQINSTVGDIKGNTDKIIAYIAKAKAKKVDLVVFPELCICGYPPKDLLLKKDFLKEIQKNLQRIVKSSKGISVIVGTVIAGSKALKPINYDVSMSVDFPGYMLNNTAAFISNGKFIGSQAKTYLPTYDIFDEQRYFVPAKDSRVFPLKNQKIGITICEDIWVDNKPIQRLKDKGATLIISISSSPFYIDKYEVRKDLVKQRAVKNKIPLFYINLVGGQDDLVFDGGSFGYDGKGKLICLAKRFEEDFVIVDTEKFSISHRFTPHQLTNGTEINRYSDKLSPYLQTIDAGEPEDTEEIKVKEIYSALVLGLRDYVEKNHFNKVVLGLSGGIDSALVACLAVSALGPKRVVLVLMPGPFSSESSIKDGMAICQNLGIEPTIVSINETYESYLKTLKPEFKNLPFGVAEENIQARVRGNILMALSNKFGYLVLTTGNKSEMSVGYSTLYGDMAGGMAVISDVPKETVYELCEYINRIGKKQVREIIPKSVFKKAPSAELRANQTDQDDLPSYDILDKIIHLYIEENKDKEEIVKMGFKESVVSDIIRRIDHNEYKRFQAPLGIKITPKAFGFGRRMPITNAFR
jgi:NAD+ synthase (glutamine-hydrolysing)